MEKANKPKASSRARAAETAAEAPLLPAMLRDSRVSIFCGIVLVLMAVYLLIVAISFFTHPGADQSLVESRTIGYLTGSATEKVHNTGGPFGAWLAENLISGWLGLGTFILIFYLGALGCSLLKMRRFRFWSLTLKCLISAITLSMVLGFLTYETSSVFYWGGMHGHYINKLLIDATGLWGALFINIVLVALTVMLFYNDLSRSYRHYKKRYDERMATLREQRRRRAEEEMLNKRRQAEQEALLQAEKRRKREELIDDSIPSDDEPDTTGTPSDQPHITATPEVPSITFTSPSAGGTSSTGEVQMVVNQAKPIEEADNPAGGDTYDPTAELSRFRLPTLDLLAPVKEHVVSIDQQEQEENKERIIETLAHYDIAISHIEATVGPTVTLYEIKPAEGVRIAKIKNLEDDIALNLEALGIRIIAPIPGRGTIGIEVPNKDPQVVPIRAILSSSKYAECKMELPMAMGSTVANEVFIADLTKMPHLLVAGATGMGKSVGLNTIIASLLYKKHPAELKFVLIDPKMVEFSLYSRLERHYLAKLPGDDDAIITDPKKVVATLNSLCVEMDNRYNLLKMAGDRNIKDYNRRFTERRLNPEKGHRYLPYIVVIVDEFADLIMTAGKEVETPIARLAQKARAVGIHLILATQRPSTNVITGIIKANFPGRVAFRVTQMVDSRTILDRPGANQLIGRGDMLFSRDGDITRVQCAFIDTPEVEAICDAIDEQVGYEQPYLLPDYIPDEGGEGGSVGGNNFGDRDPLFDEAARAIVTSGVASTSSLQRRYSIGYNRAGKIMDQLEAAGIVGPSQGGKPRAVLVGVAELESVLNP